MDDERLMNDDAVEDAVLRYLDESPDVVSGMAPSRDLWPDIEARIGARVLPLGRDSVEVRHVHQMRRRPAWLAMAAAAAFLVASTAGVTYVLTKRLVPAGATSRVATTPPATTPAPSSVSTTPIEAPTQVATATPTPTPTPTPDDATKGEASGTTSQSRHTTLEAGETHEALRATSGVSSRGAATSLARYPVTGSDEARVTYDDEITRLHGVLDARRDQLDPATVATVERNLRIIDDAITQARTALAKDPHSRMLNEQLDRTLAKKTQLLRAATLLPSA